MKKINKYLFNLILLLVGILTFNDTVYAADYAWPFNHDSDVTLPGGYADMEYCVYKTGTVNKMIGNNEVSTFYSNKTYVFAHQYMNGGKGEIYLLSIEPTKGDPTLGFTKKLERTINGGDDKSVGKVTWNSDGDVQKIIFKNDLYDYLVDDKGVLNCTKYLYFIETDNNNSFIHEGDDGNLEIYTIDGLVSALKNGDLLSWEVKMVEESETIGTLVNGENNIVTKCDDYLTKVTEIKNQYVNDQKGPFDDLASIANREAQDGDGQLALEYYNKAKAVIEKASTDLAALQFTEVDNGSGFYTGNCTGINDLQHKVKSLNSAITAGTNVIASYYNKILGNLQAAQNAGVPDLEDDLEKMEEIKEDFDEFVSIWKQYLENINLGKPIENVTCEGMLGEELLDEISNILTWIRIAVPIIVILLGSVDFAKAVLSDDQQELKKSTGRFVKRCIIAVAIFFIPSLIMYILSFIDKIAKVSCDIRLW